MGAEVNRLGSVEARDRGLWCKAEGREVGESSDVSWVLVCLVPVTGDRGARDRSGNGTAAVVLISGIAEVFWVLWCAVATGERLVGPNPAGPVGGETGSEGCACRDVDGCNKRCSSAAASPASSGSSVVAAMARVPWAVGFCSLQIDGFRPVLLLTPLTAFDRPCRHHTHTHVQYY